MQHTLHLDVAIILMTLSFSGCIIIISTILLLPLTKMHAGTELQRAKFKFFHENWRSSDLFLSKVLS
jgi:hypothetical protein